MIKISPSSLHERHQCRRCIWIQYNHGWSWPWSAGLYPRFSALEENYLPTLNCCDVLNNFHDEGGDNYAGIVEAEWLGSKGLVQGQPLKEVDSHGRGDVIIGGEFDLMARFKTGGDPTLWQTAIIDAKTTSHKDFEALKKWAKKTNLNTDPCGYSWQDLDDKEMEDTLRFEFNWRYSEKYLPQLASYAYCLENPASAEQIAEYKAIEPENLWPKKPTKRRRVPKDPDNPIAYDKITAAGILMFAFEKNIELHADKFHFTAQSDWTCLFGGENDDHEELSVDQNGLVNWEGFITPLAQKVCDIIAEPELPPTDETCENCVNEREHQAVLDG